MKRRKKTNNKKNKTETLWTWIFSTSVWRNSSRSVSLGNMVLYIQCLEWANRFYYKIDCNRIRMLINYSQIRVSSLKYGLLLHRKTGDNIWFRIWLDCMKHFLMGFTFVRWSKSQLDMERTVSLGTFGKINMIIDFFGMID